MSSFLLLFWDHPYCDLPHTFGFVYLWKQFPNFSSGRHMFCMANICKFPKVNRGWQIYFDRLLDYSSATVQYPGTVWYSTVAVCVMSHSDFLVLPRFRLALHYCLRARGGSTAASRRPFSDRGVQLSTTDIFCRKMENTLLLSTVFRVTQNPGFWIFLT